MTSPREKPLLVECEVATNVHAAFNIWTSKAGIWWPKSHTVSGNPTSVVFEPRVGGRIVETAPDGIQHVWGEVFECEAPYRIAFDWFLFFDRDSATRVEMQFTAHGNKTLIRLEQTGFAALGDAGRIRRKRTVNGWKAVTDAYTTMWHGQVD